LKYKTITTEIRRAVIKEQKEAEEAAESTGGEVDAEEAGSTQSALGDLLDEGDSFVCAVGGECFN